MTSIANALLNGLTLGKAEGMTHATSFLPIYLKAKAWRFEKDFLSHFTFDYGRFIQNRELCLGKNVLQQLLFF